VRMPFCKSTDPADPARKADSARRSPFVGPLPKASKRGSAGELREVPVHIRSVGDEFGSPDELYIRRKLGTRLSKFASSIERVSVRIQDWIGPRGGIDRRCRIKVALSGLPSVVFERRDGTVNAAVDGALAGVERAVRRAVQRRRTKPLRRLPEHSHALPARMTSGVIEPPRSINAPPSLEIVLLERIRRRSRITRSQASGNMRRALSVTTAIAGCFIFLSIEIA